MDIIPITDYFERAKKRLLSQFKESQNLIYVLQVMVERLQNYDDTLIQVLRNRWVDTAVGVQLDVLAKIVGTRRMGMTDDQLRDAIKLQIGINTSTGAPPSLIDIIKIITGADLVHIMEDFPACVDVWIDTDSMNNYVVDTIERILSAGVCFRLRIGQHPFGFFGDNTASGFASTDESLDDPAPGRFISVLN